MEQHNTWPGWECVRLIGGDASGKVYEIRKTDGSGELRAALKVIPVPRDQDEYQAFLDDGYDEKSITEILKSRVETIEAEFDLIARHKNDAGFVSYEDHMILPNNDNKGWDVLIRMELLTSLPAYINQNGGIGESGITRLGMDIASVLETCGAENIIHRNIKPQNIFVNDEGEFKLGDFSSAENADYLNGQTKAATYSYMAPEVYRNQDYSPASDSYSLGMVMYWAANDRRLPFLPLPPEVPTAAQRGEALKKRIGGEAIPAPANVSPDLAEVITKACAAEPADRFTDLAEFKAGLDKVAVRLAEEEAARRAAEEEAARKAAEEEAARKAAEEEAARRAAEEEAARRAAEEEAARKAAEEEAARKAAEEEAARKAAEEEAARKAAEEEAARRVAEEEAARKAAEAVRIAAEKETARIAAEQEAACKAAEEESARKASETVRLATEEAARKASEVKAAPQINEAEEEICPACGCPTIKGGDFCIMCGAKIIREAPKPKYGRRFCTNCGKRLPDGVEKCPDCYPEISGANAYTTAYNTAGAGTTAATGAAAAGAAFNGAAFGKMTTSVPPAQPKYDLSGGPATSGLITYRVKCPSCGKVQNGPLNYVCQQCGASHTVDTANHGFLQLYRMGNYMGMASPESIYLNGEGMGFIGNTETVVIELAPGSYNIHLAMNALRNCDDIVVKIEPGKTVYVKSQFKMGMIKNKIVLFECSEAEMPKLI